MQQQPWVWLRPSERAGIRVRIEVQVTDGEGEEVARRPCGGQADPEQGVVAAALRRRAGQLLEGVSSPLSKPRWCGCACQ